MTIWATPAGLILRIIEVGGNRQGDYSLAEIRLQAGPTVQQMTYHSDVRSWGYWEFHLKNTAGLEPEVVDQIRKRLQEDHDGYVDVPLPGPVFLHQLGLEPIVQA